MGYKAGETILDDQYNNFVASSSSPYGINHIFGTGSLQYGLGQTALAQTSAGTTISASQWNSLFSAMNNVANHTNDSITSTTSRSAGDPIAVISALQGDLNTLAASVAAGCPNATALSTSATLVTSNSSTRWAGSHVVEQSTTFSDANHMRWFFNAGGKIQINLSRLGNGGSSATSKDTSFDQLISAIGTFLIKSQTSTRSGSGETVSTNGLANGFYDLGTGYTTLLRLTQDSGTYTSNYIQIEAKLNAAPGTATVITVKTSLVDADGGDGTFTSGNTSGVDQYANFVGQTSVILKNVDPTTAEGLSQVYTRSGAAQVTNTTA